MVEQERAVKQVRETGDMVKRVPPGRKGEGERGREGGNGKNKVGGEGGGGRKKRKRGTWEEREGGGR